MIISSLGHRIPRPAIAVLLRGRFGEQKDETKIQTMGFKKNAVNDFTKIAFQPDEKLQFVNGKCLIYKNNRSIFRAALQNAFYWVPILGMAYLIYTNPFATTFPAAIPILGFLDLVVLKLWLNKIKFNQNLVSEIYLLQNGQTTEIWFANKMKRRLFGEEQKKVYYNSVFVNPDFEREEVIMLNKSDKIFPDSVERAQRQQGGYAWVKHFSNGQNFLVIPKQADSMNMKVLVQIFKGKIIKRRGKPN